MLRRLSLLTLLALPLAVACSETKVAADPDKVSVELRPETVVASRSEAMAAVVGPSTIKFPATAAIVAKLVPGKVILGEPAFANGKFLRANPDGFLRKVVSVTVEGNVATVNTMAATIDEAFSEFHMVLSAATPNFNPGASALETKGGGGGAPPPGGPADPVGTDTSDGADPADDPAAADPVLDGAQGAEEPAVNDPGADPVADPVDEVGAEDTSEPAADDAAQDESKSAYDGPVPPDAKGNIFDWRIANKSLYSKQFGAGGANGGVSGSIAISIAHAWVTAKYKIDTKIDANTWSKTDASVNGRFDGSLGAVLKAQAAVDAAGNIEFGKEMGEEPVYESENVPMGGFKLPLIGNITPKAKLEVKLKCQGDASGRASGHVGFSANGYAELGVRYQREGFSLGNFSTRTGKGFTLTPYYQFDAEGSINATCTLVSYVHTSLWGVAYGNVDVNGSAEAHATASTSGGIGKTTDSQVCGAFKATLKGTADAKLEILGKGLSKHFNLFDMKVNKGGEACSAAPTTGPCLEEGGKAKADGFYCGSEDVEICGPNKDQVCGHVVECKGGAAGNVLSCGTQATCDPTAAVVSAADIGTAWDSVCKK